MRETSDPGPKDIDFVILWVDGSDPVWLEEKRRYAPSQGDDDRPQRYRDFGLLRYWFRGVERFAPWVRRIHFVTWGHLPPWLNTAHPGLHIVKHSDYLPEAYRPTFNCNTLELNLFRIEGLSEQFVYFNDDMFLLDRVEPEDFFIHGRPVDMLALQPVVANPKNPVMSHILINDSLVICKYFDKRTQMKKWKGKYFCPAYPPKYLIYNLLETLFPLYTGFYTVHGPSPLLKQSFRELWAREYGLLDEISRKKFRGNADVNQYIFREWEKQQGNFVPANLHRKFCYLDIADRSGRVERVIRGQKRKLVCLNDADRDFDFESAMASLGAALSSILPEPSRFEKQPDENPGESRGGPASCRTEPVIGEKQNRVERNLIDII